ncbi:MAG: hypothetical protein Kow00127_12370 [Bacteroidales bacterium]
MYRIFGLLSLIVLLGTGCRTDHCVCVEYYQPVCGSNGRTYANPCEADCDGIQWVEGSCPVYGIGWIRQTSSTDSVCMYSVEVFNSLYHPDSLPQAFRQNDLPVSLVYRKSGKFNTCDDPYLNLEIINIVKIETLQ